MSAAGNDSGRLTSEEASDLYRQVVLDSSRYRGDRASGLDGRLTVARWPFVLLVAALAVAVAAGFLVRVPVRIPLTPVESSADGITAITAEHGTVAPGLTVLVSAASAETTGTVTGVGREDVPGGTVTVVTVETAERVPEEVDGLRVLLETGTRPLLTDILGQDR
ncbi:hypothetical protein ACWFMI_00935 [Nocardiopsis terrae]